MVRRPWGIWRVRGGKGVKFGLRLIRGLGAVGLVLWSLILGAAPVVLPSTSAYAQSNIEVQGNRRVEAATIRSYFRPGPSGRLGAYEIDEAYKTLYGTGLFQEVNIRQAGGRIIVTVVENPVINRIAFEGNTRVKDDQLKLEIQSKERGTLSRGVVQSDVQRLVEVYRRSGRYDVNVVPKIIDLPNGRVDLVYEISEGGKTTILSVEFAGNRAYSSFRLKDVIKTTQTNILSFLQSTNIYDQDRLEADRELLRRFYLKNGYIDVRVVSAAAEFDPQRNGFVVVYTIEEGEQYRVGAVDVRSNVRAVDPGLMRSKIRTSPGDVYNAEALEKSVEEMTIEASRQGYAFAVVRPRADRDYEARLVNLIYTVDDGQRLYIEQINVRGNTRTRDHVIRREFDVAEGDPYNRALINRAERRLRNLGYFKEVKIMTEPGSSPDRVIINVLVEEQSTGEFSIGGGYSTSDGLLAEVSVGERNLMGYGLYAKASVQYGQYSSGYSVSFVEPYLLGYRVALGVDLFSRIQRATNFVSYETRTTGGGLRLGFTLREDLSLQLRYSAYSQKIEIPQALRNCNNIDPNWSNTFPTPGAVGLFPPPVGYDGIANCYADGEASLAVRRELSQGTAVTSLVGYDLAYNTLDNNRNPTSGVLAVLKQDFAGVGGDVQYIRTTADVRSYYEPIGDVIGVLRLQGGYIHGWGDDGLRMLDHFQMGPNLVRGFAPSGIGPRDLTQGTRQDALGGSAYWGASVEFQTPLFFAPKEVGIKLAVFADAGSLWNYTGPTSWLPPLPGATGEFLNPSSNGMFVNSSVGVGLLWASPFGPLRFDLAYPITKQPWDRTQVFRFSGGTTF
ncbi:MAG: outer membrane protein assembly factor BamA [Rhizobiales bacterium]|nr:outer membrane protein assembly factor BamA [Hyphomicrobiales bacterium]